jgi:hypothetical protein
MRSRTHTQKNDLISLFVFEIKNKVVKNVIWGCQANIVQSFRQTTCLKV